MIAAIVIAIVAVVAVPLVLLFVSIEPGWWMAAPLCLRGLLGFVLFALIGAIVETFTSATWTLVYRELMGVGAGVDIELVELEPEPDLDLDLDPDEEAAEA
jgi:hypothetical protein